MSQQMTKAAQASLQTLDDMVSRLQRKQAAANTEPGGYTGASTHPSTSVDDNTDDAEEGARSAENTADVKADQGSPSVDSTTPGTPGGQDSVQMNIGTNQAATGEDPAVETASAKGGKDDGGYTGPSSHPARTDNDSLDGHKYAQVRERIKSASDAGQALLARLAAEADESTRKTAVDAAVSGKPPAGSEKLPPETVSDADSDANNPPPGKGKAKEAATAGASLAAAVAGGDGQNVKAAQDDVVKQSLAETVQVAFRMADKTASYLDHYAKLAMEEAGSESSEPSEGSESSDDRGSGGDGPVMPGSEGGAGSGGGEDELLALLAGGDSMGAEDAAAGMGGDAGGMGGPAGMGGDMGGDMGSSTTAPMMEMAEIDRLDIAAGEAVSLQPGGYHIMLMNLAAPLTEGQELVVTLTFENAGDIEVTAVVGDGAP